MVLFKWVKNFIRVIGYYFIFLGLIVELVFYYIIQIVGEVNVDYVVIEYCVLQNVYEQLFKVSYWVNSLIVVDYGIICYCIFGYIEGIGLQYYIGGVDLYFGQYWLIDFNQFFGIVSFVGRVVEYVIYLWNNSGYNQVINNVIINSDCGIGFGMGGRGNQGGLISGNIIYYVDNKYFYVDVGIIFEFFFDIMVK